MVIVKFKGGLGNQMFQYTFARWIEIKLGQKVLLDATWYKTKHAKRPYCNRNLEIRNFKICKNFSDGIPINFFLKWLRKLKNYRFFGEIISKEVIIIDEKDFLTGIFLPQKNFIYIMDGYWQSEQFPREIRNVISSEFQLRTPFSEQDKRIIEEMKDCDSVSLHIRRGDYAYVKETHDYHGVLGKNYYNDAIKLLRGKKDKIKLFVFSDDIEWCQRHLNFSVPWKIISDGIRSASKELILMSNSKHYIIANSSFSWWAAWLGEKKESIIISPKQWFRDRKPLLQLMPQRWYSL